MDQTIYICGASLAHEHWWRLLGLPWEDWIVIDPFLFMASIAPDSWLIDGTLSGVVHERITRPPATEYGESPLSFTRLRHLLNAGHLAWHPFLPCVKDWVLDTRRIVPLAEVFP